MTTILRERAAVREAVARLLLDRKARALQTGIESSAWRDTARPEQLIPIEEDDPIVQVKGGRGSGKTRTGAETLAEWIRSYPRGDWGVVAPTFADARDKCIEGPSGLIAALGPRMIDRWNRSLGELVTTTGHTVHIDGADDGAPGIQGYNLRGVWADEIGLWRKWSMAWDESIAFAVRIEPARIIVTGTPKAGHGLVRKLNADPLVRKIRMSTRDNAANLAPNALAALEARYGGTRLGRQELEGEDLDDTPGALWTWAMIEEARVYPLALASIPLPRVVVAIDPSGGAGEEHDEVGIVAAGISAHGEDDRQHGYVLADKSGHYSPREWAIAALELYDELQADEIVAETNYGGDMVVATIQAVRPGFHVRKVTASRGKAVRAQPISSRYEQRTIHHVGSFERLEEEQTSWVPGSDRSPNRVDALVWAFTELFGDEGSAFVY